MADEHRSWRVRRHIPQYSQRADAIQRNAVRGSDQRVLTVPASVASAAAGLPDGIPGAEMGQRDGGFGAWCRRLSCRAGNTSLHRQLRVPSTVGGGGLRKPTEITDYTE